MNTLAINERLIASGTPEQQAKVHAHTHQETLQEAQAYTDKSLEGLATRADLLEAIAGLREDNAKLRQEMADRETRMTRFTVGAMIGGMTVLTAIFGIFVAPAIQAALG